jgi:putative ABC transport system permease protein
MLTLSVYRTLSLRYLSQRWTRASLIVCSIALGVATLVATRALNETMSRAAQASTSPLAGTADLLVSNGRSPISRTLGTQLARVPGVRAVRPLIVEKVELPDLTDPDQAERKDAPGRTVLLLGVDVASEAVRGDNPWGIEVGDDTKAGYLRLWSWRRGLRDWPDYQTIYSVWPRAGLPLPVQKVFAPALACFRPPPPVVVGATIKQELDKYLENNPSAVRVWLPDRDDYLSYPVLSVQVTGKRETQALTCVGTVEARGAAAALAGNMLITDLDAAAVLLGQAPGLVSRLDILLEPEADRDLTRQRLEERLAQLGSKAEVRTPEEQTRMTENAMSGMQLGFTLCGLGALVVGLFLVYNALSVSVAERRHEIGILRSLGATRGQVRGLFASEAALLGLAGAALGVPLGVGLAYLGLAPIQKILEEIFFKLDARQVEVTPATVLLAVAAGVVTALLAALVPAFRATQEQPANAVRRVPLIPTWSHRVLQLSASGVLVVAGLSSILLRAYLPARLGSYGGLVMVLLGTLLATPLLAAVASRLVQPLARRFLGIEGRLAADNLVRAPARTGLVIAALAAGVSLVMQTAGTIRSNRVGVREWIQNNLVADLVISAGSPVSAGGHNEPMDEGLREQLRQLGGESVRAVVPLRFRHRPYRDTQVFVEAIPARAYYDALRDRPRQVPDLDHYRRLSEERGTVLISDNFAALYGVGVGDTITLSGVDWRVAGTVVDYSWNHGAVIMDWGDYQKQFKDHDPRVSAFDVYLAEGADVEEVRRRIVRSSVGLDRGLVALTHDELQEQIDSMIERLYAIAYGQEIVVGLVAALGVVTALLISVLQRRRELGMLRAIGASKAQVIRSVLAEAALMGVIGTAIGFLAGVPLEWYILRVVFLEESGYLFPVLIPWRESAVIAGVALLTATLAGLGPALHAVRQRIPEAIAYE